MNIEVFLSCENVSECRVNVEGDEISSHSRSHTTDSRGKGKVVPVL